MKIYWRRNEIGKTGRKNEGNKTKKYRNENEYNDISIKEKIKGKNKQNGENIIIMIDN